MSNGARHSPTRGLGTAVAGVAAVTALAALLGHPGFAEVLGGGLIVYLAVHFGRLLNLQLAIERDPGRQLGLDLLLVLIVVLGLIGVGVMAAALP